MRLIVLSAARLPFRRREMAARARRRFSASATSDTRREWLAIHSSAWAAGAGGCSAFMRGTVFPSGSNVIWKAQDLKASRSTFWSGAALLLVTRAMVTFVMASAMPTRCLAAASGHFMHA